MTLTMIEVKTADLIGKALDWAVGIADGRELELPSAVKGRKGVVWCDPFVIKREGRPDFHDKTRRKWEPSTDWSHGGPLIEKHRIELRASGSENWWADKIMIRIDPSANDWCGFGPTPLVAACRAIVQGWSGDTISVPKELMP